MRSQTALVVSFFFSLPLLGCGGGDDETSARPVTWHQDIAPMVAQRCNGCHVDNNIAPFALDSYEKAKPLASVMLDAVEGGRMPPWLAQDTPTCKPKLPWKDDLRLSAKELSDLQAWVAAGAPEGDPATAAPLPEPPKLSIETPSASMTFEAPFTVDGDKDDFQCFVLDPKNTQTMWVTAAQLRPGNNKVAHHGLVFVDVKGESTTLIEKDGRFSCFNPPSVAGYLVNTWAPGAAPLLMPATAGIPIPAGAKIVVQMHYHPTGKGPEVDQSTVDFEWTSTQPEWEAAQALIGNFNKTKADGTGLLPGPNDGATAEFSIPAGVSDHTETMVYRQTIPLEIPVFSVGTHMHYVGTNMKIDYYNKIEEAEECLVETPNWNFNWQRFYNYDAPISELPKVRVGDELRLRCDYNNTMQNRFVAQALKDKGISQPIDVKLGEQTTDEMCLGIFGILAPPGALEQIF